MIQLPIFLANPPKRDSKYLGVEGRHIGEMLRHRAEQTPDVVAYRSKQNGTWQQTTWAQAYQRARRIALGLLSIGVQLGDRIAILSGTREEWTLSDQGILLSGAVTVPLYPSIPKEGCLYIINHSDSMVAFVEDEKQIEKLPHQATKARKLIVLSPTYSPLSTQDERVLTLEKLEELGHVYGTKNPGILEQIDSQLTGKSTATITYTSGTTGTPKGAIITHDAFTVGTRYAIEATPTEPEDTQLFFLPLSHSFAHMISIYAIRIGMCIAFAESIDKLIDNLSEIKPTCMLAVPRIFEKVYQGFLQKAREGGRFKQNIVTWALQVGKAVSKELQAGRHPKGLLAYKYKLADRLVFHKLRERLGGNLKWLISGSAPLSTEIIEFFHGAGIIILEGYGLTETNSITTVNRIDHFKFGTVGQVHHSDLLIRLATDGEIITKGISNFKGYFKMTEATKEAIDEEGWFHTGDIGTIDQEGFLTITDRKKDLIKTSSGKFVAPQMLEGLLKLHPLVSQAVVIGDRRQYITALVSVNQAAAKTWLNQTLGTTVSDGQILTHPSLEKELTAYIARTNQQLGSWEQIKYFRILPRELSEAEGEVTPSLKIKRKVVLDRYKELVDSMYTDALTQQHSHSY